MSGESTGDGAVVGAAGAWVFPPCLGRLWLEEVVSVFVHEGGEAGPSLRVQRRKEAR